MNDSIVEINENKLENISGGADNYVEVDIRNLRNIRRVRAVRQTRRARQARQRQYYENLEQLGLVLGMTLVPLTAFVLRKAFDVDEFIFGEPVSYEANRFMAAIFTITGSVLGYVVGRYFRPRNL